MSYPNDSTRDILFTRGQEGTNISVWAEKDSVKEVLEDTVINEDEPQASLKAEGGIDMMLRTKAVWWNLPLSSSVECTRDWIFL